MLYKLYVYLCFDYSFQECWRSPETWRVQLGLILRGYIWTEVKNPMAFTQNLNWLKKYHDIPWLQNPKKKLNCRIFAFLQFLHGQKLERHGHGFLHRPRCSGSAPGDGWFQEGTGARCADAGHHLGGAVMDR